MSSTIEPAEESPPAHGGAGIEAIATAGLEGVAQYAERSIDTLADSMADLLGGGPAPATMPAQLTSEESRQQACLDEIREAQQAEVSANGPENPPDTDATPSRSRG